MTNRWNNTELYHHGILGMKWGVRRYQNKDGSLTTAGKKRYNENYKDKQISSDRVLYGRGGNRRISRDMDKGMSYSGARSIEVQRINKAAMKNKRVKKTAAIVSGFAAFPAIYAAEAWVLKKLTGVHKPGVWNGASSVNKLVDAMNTSTGQIVNMAVVGIGAKKISDLTGDVATKVHARSKGYSRAQLTNR